MNDAALAAAICRHVRRRTGWTQAELARRMQVERSTISRWESTGRGVSDRNLRKLLDLLIEAIEPKDDT